MESLLITGANGFLGSNCIKKLMNNYNVSGLDISCTKKIEGVNYFEIDITKQDNVNSLIKNNHFDIIIHCAALINPDVCEKNFQLAQEINAFGTKNLVQNFKGVFIYISTDMLFDGTQGNYKEDDIPNPINNYGKTKLEAEQYVRQYTNKHYILRTNFFGWNNDPEKVTFAEWVYNSLVHEKPINLFYDYIFNPIYIFDFISIADELIKKTNYGVYNVVGKDSISKYEFGMLLAEKFGLNKNLINKVSIRDHNFHAMRPEKMSLNTNKTEALGFTLPGIKEGLNRFYEDRQGA
jgi:dTDP-4-dehydrorhamnose reductase